MQTLVDSIAYPGKPHLPSYIPPIAYRRAQYVHADVSHK